MISIKETVVVEGRDDITAVKRAVDCEVISTHGFGYGMKLISILKKIDKKKGIIIFTDADYVGNKIREDLSFHIPTAKHAFLSRKESEKNGNIGVENASKSAIREALLRAKPVIGQREIIFTLKDLAKNNLAGGENSSIRRQKLCEYLNIGHGNAKKTVNRLNSFGISRKEFDEALKRL